VGPGRGVSGLPRGLCVYGYDRSGGLEVAGAGGVDGRLGPCPGSRHSPGERRSLQSEAVNICGAWFKPMRFEVENKLISLGVSVANLSITVLVLSGCAVLLSSCGSASSDNNNPDNAILYASCGNTPNYAAELGSFRMHRWKQFPLSVAIDLTAAPKVSEGTNRQVYTRAIQAGVLKWNVGNGIGTVNFVTSADPDILIRFTDTLPVGTLGFTDKQGPRPYILKGTVISLSVQAFSTFLLGPAGTGRDFETNLRLVTAHEMGHALFAGAHPTGVSNSIMGLLQENVTQLDINTIRESYCSSGIRPATPGTVSGI
jgi:hypothetical protein